MELWCREIINWMNYRQGMRGSWGWIQLWKNSERGREKGKDRPMKKEACFSDMGCVSCEKAGGKEPARKGQRIQDRAEKTDWAKVHGSPTTSQPLAESSLCEGKDFQEKEVTGFLREVSAISVKWKGSGRLLKVQAGETGGLPFSRRFWILLGEQHGATGSLNPTIQQSRKECTACLSKV